MSEKIALKAEIEQAVNENAEYEDVQARLDKAKNMIYDTRDTSVSTVGLLDNAQDELARAYLEIQLLKSHERITEDN